MKWSQVSTCSTLPYPRTRFTDEKVSLSFLGERAPWPRGRGISQLKAHGLLCPKPNPYAFAPYYHPSFMPPLPPPRPKLIKNMKNVNNNSRLKIRAGDNSLQDQNVVFISSFISSFIIPVFRNPVPVIKYEIKYHAWTIPSKSVWSLTVRFSIMQSRHSRL